MHNPFQKLLALIPDPALRAGVVLAVVDDIAIIELPGGGQVRAHGPGLDATLIGTRGFVRAGVVEGPAPDLSVELIEIGSFADPPAPRPGDRRPQPGGGVP